MPTHGAFYAPFRLFLSRFNRRYPFINDRDHTIDVAFSCIECLSLMLTLDFLPCYYFATPLRAAPLFSPPRRATMLPRFMVMLFRAPRVAAVYDDVLMSCRRR